MPEKVGLCARMHVLKRAFQVNIQKQRFYIDLKCCYSRKQ